MATAAVDFRDGGGSDITTDDWGAEIERAILFSMPFVFLPKDGTAAVLDTMSVVVLTVT